MLIAGVDPGTATTGYAFLACCGNSMVLRSYGCIRTSASKSQAERVLEIYRAYTALLDEYKPDVVAVERLFFNRNVTNALFVGQATGVLLLAAAERGIPVVSYTPLQVKMALVGYGRAHKHQVQAMVKQLLSLDELPRPDDAADAIAVAICHAHTADWQANVEGKK